MNKHRLIDANKLIKTLCETFCGENPCSVPCETIEAIEKCPTAYDIDKVVRELESNKTSRNIINRDGVAIGCIDNTKIEIDKAIKIVRNGGGSDV